MQQAPLQVIPEGQLQVPGVPAVELLQVGVAPEQVPQETLQLSVSQLSELQEGEGEQHVLLTGSHS